MGKGVSTYERERSYPKRYVDSSCGKQSELTHIPPYSPYKTLGAEQLDNGQR